MSTLPHAPGNAPRSPLVCDLNCDLGEDPSPAGVARDEALCAVVTSINVACGGHAGDDASMSRLAHLAREHRLILCAHPGYPDPANFGRVELAIDVDALERSILEQLRALGSAAASAGVTVARVKAHGALYHASMRDAAATNGARVEPPAAPAACGALLRATLAARTLPGVDPRAGLVVQAGPPGDSLASLAQHAGLPVVREAFADRAYEPDGTLRPRALPGAVLADPALAAGQAREIARHRRVACAGGWLALGADTICVHSDSPGATAIARAVRAALDNTGGDNAAPDPT